MHLEVIDNLQEYETLKPTWDSIYNGDPNAHVFSSWGWLKGFFESTKNRWLVIGLKPSIDDDYAAFFPLTIYNHKLTFTKVLQFGGSPVADYTGFVCKPEYVNEAIEKFSNYLINDFSWDRFHLKDIADNRINSLISKFPQNSFRIQEINCVCCPYIDLPNTWDEYLVNKLSRAARSKLKRRMNKLSLLPDFRSVEIDENNFDEQIDTLLTLWREHWEICSNGYINIFKRSFENNLLWVKTLYSGKIPLASLAAFKDEPRKAFRVFITAYNNEYSQFAPGRVLFAESIRYAIENGYRIYDFLRGDEDYKFRFGADTRTNSYLIISSNNLKIKFLDKSINVYKKLIHK
jgi:CelD/BcsL family acetyltransferase involved in cellulose biosynthesis